MKTCEMNPEPARAVVSAHSAPKVLRGDSTSPPVRASAVECSNSPQLVQIATLVLWVGCSLIAALGLTLPYARPHAAKAQPEPMLVEMLSVELAHDPLPDLDPPSVNPLAGPPPPDAVAQPQLPQAVAVTTPSPTIAFALPVEGPVRVVEAAHASHSSSPINQNAVNSEAPPVQTLTFGQGAGKQPAPEYPLRAQSERQEGIVSVRFTVTENGRVAAAEAVAPSPWPLLNDSAVRTIRNRWRFAAGTQRAYEVAIRFILPK